jgi:hypothetical protein
VRGALLAAVFAAGCSSGAAATPRADAGAPSTASATSSASATTSESAAAPTASAPFVRLHTLPAGTRLFPVESALVACADDCRVPKGAAHAPPKTWLVTRAHADEDPTLWFEGAYRGLTRDATDRMPEPVRAAYFGRWPDDLRAAIRHPWDARTGRGLPVVTRASEGWKEGGLDEGLPQRWPFWGELTDADDAAIALAPFRPGARSTAGGGGPLVIVDAAGEQAARWDGRAWTTLDRPFRACFDAERLTNGATLLLTDLGPFLLSKDGAFTPALPRDAQRLAIGVETLLAFTIDGEPWLGARGQVATDVFAPAARGALEVAHAARRGPVPRAPIALDAMPAPTELEDACATPFVVLEARIRDQGWTPVTTLEALAGHAELQGALTFVAFTRGGARTFGAQASTVDAARALVAAYTSARRRSPPIVCLDAAAHATTGATPAKGVVRYVVNLRVGFVVREIW